MLIVYLTVAFFTFLIFPYFLTISLFYDNSERRLNIRLDLYGKIKIFSSYATIRGKNIFLHVSESKAILFDLTKIKFRGTIKNLKSIEPIELKTQTVFPLKIESVPFVTILSVLENMTVPILLEKKDFLKIGNSIDVLGDEIYLSAKSVVCFNLIVVIKILFKMMWGIK